MRIEFLVSNWIGVHPMALVHPERVADPKERAEIRRRAAGHASLPEFFVARLAEGVAQIGAAFHPRPVIVRFSDFKTNEYAGLLGGAAFEPEEANPMIGFRGASRYYDERYREGFALECAAIRRVRDEMGLIQRDGDDPLLSHARRRSRACWPRWRSTACRAATTGWRSTSCARSPTT